VLRSRPESLIRCESVRSRSRWQSWMSTRHQHRDIHPRRRQELRSGVARCDPAYRAARKAKHERRFSRSSSRFWAGKTCSTSWHQPIRCDLVGTLERGPECTHLRARPLAITAEPRTPTRRAQQTHSWRFTFGLVVVGRDPTPERHSGPHPEINGSSSSPLPSAVSENSSCFFLQ